MALIHGLWRQGLIALLLVPFLAAEAQAGPGSQWKLLGDRGALRSAPQEDAAAVAQVGPGDRLLEFERRVDWLRVGLFGAVGVEGWIREKELLPLTLAPEPLPVAPAPEDPEPELLASAFVLDIAGSPALAFKAKCRVDGDGQGRKALKFSGFVPRRLRFEAAAVSCRVRKWDAIGRLTLRLYQDGQIVASRSTAAAFNAVTVRSDGPWGKAKGSRGSVPLVRRQPTVPPGRPVPVPRKPVIPRIEP